MGVAQTSLSPMGFGQEDGLGREHGDIQEGRMAGQEFRDRLIHPRSFKVVNIVKDDQPSRGQAGRQEFETFFGRPVNVHVKVAEGYVRKVQVFCCGGEIALDDFGVGFARKQFNHHFISCIREIVGFETLIFIAQGFESAFFKRIKTIEISAPILNGVTDMQCRPSFE